MGSCWAASARDRWTGRQRHACFLVHTGSLQLLEQQVVGGEQAKNKDLKEKHKRRKRYADERRKQLVAALQNSDEDGGDWVLLNVYDSIQEEVRAKSKLLEKVQRKVRPPPAALAGIRSFFTQAPVAGPLCAVPWCGSSHRDRCASAVPELTFGWECVCVPITRRQRTVGRSTVQRYRGGAAALFLHFYWRTNAQLNSFPQSECTRKLAPRRRNRALTEPQEFRGPP